MTGRDRLGYDRPRISLIKMTERSHEIKQSYMPTTENDFRTWLLVDVGVVLVSSAVSSVVVVVQHVQEVMEDHHSPDSHTVHGVNLLRFQNKVFIYLLICTVNFRPSTPPYLPSHNRSET